MKVKGPGLLYIDMKQSRNFFKRDQLSIYIIIAYVLLYVAMFGVIFLERREPLPNMSQLQDAANAVSTGQVGTQADASNGAGSFFNWQNPWLDNN